MLRRPAVALTPALMAAALVPAASGAAYSHPPASGTVPATQPAGARIAPEETAAAAAALGTTSSAADEQLARERRLGALTDAARSALGDAFGGVWVDAAHGGTIKLELVDGGSSTDAGAARDKAVQLLDQFGMRGASEIVSSPRSEAAILALQDRLDQELASANAGAAITIDAEPDVKTGTVRLDVPPTPTSVQTAFLARAHDTYGDALTTVAKPAELQTQSCSGFYCDPPLRGAIRINLPNVIQCSSGFVMRSLSDGIKYLSTAGHCTDKAGGTWDTHFADNSVHYIGAKHSSTTDFGILTIDNPTGWSPGPYIRIQSDQTYTISGWGASAVGQRVCFSGGQTDSNCGTVTGGLATRSGTPNTYRASYCTTEGDSGGSVFASNTAYGSHVGAYSSCDTVYYSANYFNVLNVVPVT